MGNISQRDSELFENLFVLEMANNHWGNVSRGIKLIRDHGTIARYNNIKAAIKLQFRDVDAFIHPDFKGKRDHRYINKTESTTLTRQEFSQLVNEIKIVSCIPMATPFDEASVDLCVAFEMPIIKIASSDINDWVLIEKIASTRKPTIVSTGGASEKDLDDIVTFFEKRDIPLAINHCVSLYPSEDSELCLDQIDYLSSRYSNHVIGLSTHEYQDWSASMLISYGKGVRTWERHIDIDYENIPVSAYCSKPEQCDEWFKAFLKAREMCGGVSNTRRVISRKETEYLDALVRGAYARHDLEVGHVITKETFENDFYLAVPLHKGQLSCREIMDGEKLINSVKADEKLTIDDIDGPYRDNENLSNLIKNRGL
jgi:N-acetylneuraminate synthase